MLQNIVLFDTIEILQMKDLSFNHRFVIAAKCINDVY